MTEVHLVTDDDATDELVRELFRSLPEGIPILNDGKPNEVSIVRKSSIEGEHKKLLELRRPTLIILDGSVRKSPLEGASIDGAPAAEMLRDLRKNETKIPIVVVSQASLEKLEFEVLSRWDVAIWKLPPPGSFDDLARTKQEFTEILKGLNGEPKKRHITISVGPRSAKYIVYDGHYIFSTDREYKVGYQPRQLIQQMKRFVPFENRQIRTNWRDELSEAGRTLYSLLIEDVFGPTLLERIKNEGHGVNFKFHIELSEGWIDSNFDDLFLLPFEATNSDMRPEGFFCTRIPMARVAGGLNIQELQIERSSDLRVLLVVGGAGGDASITSELTGAEHDGVLSPLQQGKDIVDYLEEKKIPNGAKRRVVLEVLDETTATGLEFQRLLEKKLTSSDYDIVHFYGHSNSSADGTFLFAPGDQEYTTRSINIRAVSRWLGDVRQKKRPPFLVFLSSCQSGSVRTAMEMMNSGVANVLGFRWEVKESAAVEFIRVFYRSYIECDQSLAEAYREACDQLRALDMSDSLWASGILVQRSISLESHK